MTAVEEKGHERGRQTGWLGFDDPDWTGQDHAMSVWGPVTMQSTAPELADRLRALLNAWQSTCGCGLFVITGMSEGGRTVRYYGVHDDTPWEDWEDDDPASMEDALERRITGRCPHAQLPRPNAWRDR